jgi:hypothetical protein
LLRIMGPIIQVPVGLAIYYKSTPSFRWSIRLPKPRSSAIIQPY